LCAARCDKHNESIKIKRCSSKADLRALLAFYGKCAKGDEALRDQIQVRDHVYKIKNMSIDIDSDNAEAAIARLMATLPSVVAVPLPKKVPPPPVPYSKRPAHPAPTRAAVAFELKHLEATSSALAELVANTDEGAFKAPRRRQATAGVPAAAAAAAATPKSAGKRPRQLARPQEALVGTGFEEGGADWMVLPWSGH
jgi:hypothetical protein